MILWMLLVIVIHMSVVWLIYRLIKNPSVVDVGWASGLMLCGVVYVLRYLPNTRALCLLTLLVLWAFRLGLYLLITRIMKGHVDKRYLALSEGWKIAKPLGFFLNFQLQGILILIIATPWYFIATSTKTFGWLDGLLAVIFITALLGETVADYQLQRFKRQSPGKVCDVGLWAYSRHPNYFFEWLIWCCFALLALSNTVSYLALISPLTLYLLMVYVTAPMTEAASLQSRGEVYRYYQLKTSRFFPRIKLFGSK